MGSDTVPQLSRRSVGQVLRRCVTNPNWDQPVHELDDVLRGQDATPVIAAADYQRTLPSTFLGLHGLPSLSPAVDCELQRLHLVSVVRGMHMSRSLVFAGEVLDRAGISWLALKGPVVAALYPRPELRSYNDIDVIVRPEAFEDAVIAMQRAGGTLLDANWRLIGEQMRGQVHVCLPDGTVCDLHWTLLNWREQRRSFDIPTAELFATARPVDAQGVLVQTLAPAATLVHLCLHAALSGGDRLGWLVDIDRAMRAPELRWSEVVELTTTWRARLATAAMLCRAHRILDSPVPTEIPELLAPAALRGVVRNLEKGWSVGATSHPYTTVALSTPLLRDSGLGLSPRLHRFLSPRHAAAVGVSLVRRRRPWRGAAGRPLEQVMLPSGGPRERAAYFRDVARHR